MADDLNAKMWQQFVTALTTTGGVQADPKNFLPTNGLALADWEVMDTTGLPPGDPAAKKGATIVPRLQAWANTMPQWNPGYLPGDGFYNNYVSFLNSIQLKGGDPAIQQLADAYSVKLKSARDQLQADTKAMFAAWTDFNAGQAGIPPASQTSFNNWYNDNWASTITGDQDNVAAASMNFKNAMQKVGGDDFATISKALTNAELSPRAGNALLDPATGISEPLYTISGGLNDWFVSALQSSTSGKAPAVDFTIDLSQAESHDYESSSYLNVSGSGSYGGFFSASASHSESQSASDLSSLAQKLTMRYTAQALNVFTVSPGNWYNASMIKGFHDRISPGSAFAKTPPFGPGGLLNLRAAQIYVVYRRSITLSGSQETMSAVKSAMAQENHASMSVGGMFWSAQASVDQGSQSSKADLANSEDGNSVTITDNTNAPKVIGIVPQNLDPSAT